MPFSNTGWKKMMIYFYESNIFILNILTTIPPKRIAGQADTIPRENTAGQAGTKGFLKNRSDSFSFIYFVSVVYKCLVLEKGTRNELDH